MSGWIYWRNWITGMKARKYLYYRIRVFIIEKYQVNYQVVDLSEKTRLKQREVVSEKIRALEEIDFSYFGQSEK
jgi:hypothetical protein